MTVKSSWTDKAFSTAIYKDISNTIIKKLNLLSVISENEQNLKRQSFTDEHASANELVGTWMREAGLKTHIDPIGNIVGTTQFIADKELPLFLTGSHLDTIDNAGMYDGALGVILPICCIAALHELGFELPFNIQIFGFCDEEGLRFSSTLLGSRAIAGVLPSNSLQKTDVNGVSIEKAMIDFGLTTDAFPNAKIVHPSLIGFLELHIEQGPVLETLDSPVGIVTAISGASRYKITVKGRAAHAGTTPMELRQDALCGAAESVLFIETLVQNIPQMVGTVGDLKVAHGAGNVVPSEVCFLLDIRHPSDVTRKKYESLILDGINEICAQRDLETHIETTHKASSVECDPSIGELLKNAIKDSGFIPHYLPSGAGHDAMALSELTATSMLFIRCKDGISHHPAEFVAEKDILAASKVFLRFLKILGDKITANT